MKIPVDVPDAPRSFVSDFRKFAFQGNLMDLAIGVVVGTAFKNVSTSLVEDIIMPPIGLVLGNTDFSNLYLNLSGGNYASLADAEAAGAATLNYGHFLTTFIDFLLTALSVYIVLRFFFRWHPASIEKK